MATLTVRWPDDAPLRSIQDAAAARGQSAEEFARQALAAAAASPVSKARYTLRAIGPDSAHALIRRETDGIAGRGAANMSQEQADAYRLAIELVGRNGPGDRERAVSTLQAVFTDVFEA